MQFLPGLRYVGLYNIYVHCEADVDKRHMFVVIDECSMCVVLWLHLYKGVSRVKYA